MKITHSESLSVIIHGVALNTVCQIIVQSGKNYTGQKKFTRAAPVAPVTIMRYGHSEGESLGMGGEKRLGRKVPPQFGDQRGSLTGKCVR